MAEDVDIKIDMKRFKALVKRLPKTSAQEIRAGLHLFFKTFDTKMLVERLSGRPGLRSPSGSMKASLSNTVTGNTLKTITGRASIGGRKAPHAPVHEYGAEGANAIRPKKAKMLKIPLRDARTGAGKTKAEYLRPGKNPALDLTYRTVRGRRIPFLVTKDKKPRFIFKLQKSVEIPPRLQFVDTFRNLWRAMRSRIVNRIVQRIAIRENRG